MSSCPNKNFFKQYGIECSKVDNKIKCPSKNKLKNLCPNCSYYHIVKCHHKFYALPCMYLVGIILDYMSCVLQLKICQNINVIKFIQQNHFRHFKI